MKTILFASILCLAGTSLTQNAWGADTMVYASQIGSQTLGTVDLNTGVFTQISAQAVAVSGFGVYGGALYGYSGPCGCLVQINTTTGAPTFATNFFQQNNNGFGPFNGFGSTTAGLFIMSAEANGTNLWSVDPASGFPTRIGTTGVMAGGGTGTLSASQDSTKLYWEVQTDCTDTLYSINTSTGAATLIGSANACFPSPTGNPFSMALIGGTLWANFYSDGYGTISTSSGAQTLVSTGVVKALFAMAPFPLLPPTPVLVGSMGHLAAQENWTSTFTLVNKGVAPTQATLSFFGDPTDPTGAGPLTLPVIFPQEVGHIYYPSSVCTDTWPPTHP